MVENRLEAIDAATTEVVRTSVDRQLRELRERADAAHLPRDLVCIHLTWDNITGDVLTAEIRPDAASQAT